VATTGLDHLRSQQAVLSIAEKWRPGDQLPVFAAFEPTGTPPVAPPEM
jgi:hypothetical protein